MAEAGSSAGVAAAGEFYNADFYRDRHAQTRHAAEAVLGVALSGMPEINSAVDFGCGVGTWLEVLRDTGVGEVYGLEGDWLDRSLLRIPEACFSNADLTEPVDLGRRFDLAMTLEVAEHLPPEKAEVFVGSLVRHADIVMFSAAVPNQGGVNHLNEQPPEYWAGLFAAHGYRVFDYVRWRVWGDSSIPPWYRQNVFVYASEVRASEVEERVRGLEPVGMPMSVISPDLLALRVNQKRGVKASARQLLRALKGG